MKIDKIMYNEYIYEKKLKEEKLRKNEQDKMIKYKKIHLKKTEELSNNYREKINVLLFNAVKDSYFKNNLKNNFSFKKNNNLSSNHEINNKINKTSINNNIRAYQTATNINNERTIASLSQSNNLDDISINSFIQPKMRYSPKNDLERIIDNMYYNSGKIVDLKYLNKLTIKYKKRINGRVFNFLKSKINDTTNDSINIKYPLNISESILLKDAQKRAEESKLCKKHVKIFKNKILNSKLIKNLTFNEKYKYKTFYGGIRYSLIDLIINNRKNSEIKPDSNRLHSSQNYKNNKIIKEKFDPDSSDAINNYKAYIKKFNKFNNLKNLNFQKNKSGESSDSSINDNGQEDVLKKVIYLNYPVLSEGDVKNGEKREKNLNYLKNLFKKDEKKVEYIQKKFKYRESKYFNYIQKRKKYDRDRTNSYFFYKNKGRYIFVN